MLSIKCTVNSVCCLGYSTWLSSGFGCFSLFRLAVGEELLDTMVLIRQSCPLSGGQSRGGGGSFSEGCSFKGNCWRGSFQRGSGTSCFNSPSGGSSSSRRGSCYGGMLGSVEGSKVWGNLDSFPDLVGDWSKPGVWFWKGDPGEKRGKRGVSWLYSICKETTLGLCEYKY